MTLPAPYQYKKRREPARPRVANRVRIPALQEGLTGFVKGLDASDIEERFAKALDKLGLEYSFRDHYFGPARNTPGAIEVDFMVHSGNWQPVQIDGEIAHKTVGQRSEDRRKDQRLNNYFSRHGINHVIRIPDGVRHTFTALDTQESTDTIVRGLFG